MCGCAGVRCLGVNSKLLLLWGAHAMCQAQKINNEIICKHQTSGVAN